MYLRKHMDSDGFVKLSFLMGFQRVQLHTKDIGVLRDVCLESPEITLAFGQDDYYVRRKDGWENWVLKEEDRHESARRDQRDWHIDPRQRKHIGAALTPPGEMSASAEPFFPGSGNMAPIYYSHANPPYGYPGPMSSLSATVPEFSPSPHNTLAPFNESVPPFTPDDFSDADIDLLMLVSKRLGTGDNSPVPQETSPHRPNGADAASIGERLQSTVLGNGDGVYDDSGRSSRSNGDVSHYARKSQPDDIDWFKTGYNEETNMITHRSYSEVRAQALKQREAGSVGKNNDLMTLYKFWSHFLVGKFNASIYQEFKTLALRDADQGQRSGVEYLFMVYERSLKIRGVVGYEVINDFIELVKLDASHGESLGVDKLRRLLANPELKEEFRAAVESLIDNDLHGIMSNGVGKKNSRSPAAEPYSAVGHTRFTGMPCADAII